MFAATETAAESICDVRPYFSSFGKEAAVAR